MLFGLSGYQKHLVQVKTGIVQEMLSLEYAEAATCRAAMKIEVQRGVVLVHNTLNSTKETSDTVDFKLFVFALYGLE